MTAFAFGCVFAVALWVAARLLDPPAPPPAPPKVGQRWYFLGPLGKWDRVVRIVYVSPDGEGVAFYDEKGRGAAMATSTLRDYAAPLDEP